MRSFYSQYKVVANTVSPTIRLNNNRHRKLHELRGVDTLFNGPTDIKHGTNMDATLIPVHYNNGLMSFLRAVVG